MSLAPSSSRTDFYRGVAIALRAKRHLRMGYAYLARASVRAKDRNSAGATSDISRAVSHFMSANPGGTRDNARAARDANHELIANLKVLAKLSTNSARVAPPHAEGNAHVPA